MNWRSLFFSCQLHNTLSTTASSAVCDKSWITSHVGVYLWRKAKDGVASTGFTSQRLEPYAFSPPTADDHRSIDESDIAVVLYAESVLDDWTKGVQNNARFQRRGRLLTRHAPRRNGSVDAFASVFERDGESVETVAINVRVDVVVPQLTGDRLDQLRRDAPFGIAIYQLEVDLVDCVLPSIARMWRSSRKFPVSVRFQGICPPAVHRFRSSDRMRMNSKRLTGNQTDHGELHPLERGGLLGRLDDSTESVKRSGAHRDSR